MLKQQHSGALLVRHSEERGPTADVSRSWHRLAPLRGRYRMREDGMLYCLSKGPDRLYAVAADSPAARPEIALQTVLCFLVITL